MAVLWTRNFAAYDEEPFERWNVSFFDPKTGDINEKTNLYRTELEKLPIKKKDREAMIDGFRDGIRTAIFTLSLVEKKESE